MCESGGVQGRTYVVEDRTSESDEPQSRSDAASSPALRLLAAHRFTLACQLPPGFARIDVERPVNLDSIPVLQQLIAGRQTPPNAECAG